jgi:hypothetical protein
MIPYWIGSLLTVRIRKCDVGNRAVAGWDGKQENGADAEWSLGGAYGAGEGAGRSRPRHLGPQELADCGLPSGNGGFLIRRWCGLRVSLVFHGEPGQRAIGRKMAQRRGLQ